MAVLARRVRPDQWTPIGVDALEANAMTVVRSADNRSVIAGPGAGKTELLAQRAAFLFQTGTSPPPRRILAISFKRDAATNLAERVGKRCHRSHAGRLDSMTFDAFAKGLVDRFGQALPKRWRPRPDYEIMFTNDALYRGFLFRTLAPRPRLSAPTPISRRSRSRRSNARCSWGNRCRKPAGRFLRLVSGRRIVSGNRRCTTENPRACHFR